ncbi:hypothetical protein FisN_UnNu057 [Fistulifera solaris]|uniref:Uncharacterized protein n=1 Tax=Fistulifera solaris TaxID=1519565 RepID=A0A1Z5JPU0_FISSO|nr:hypothetical protein FisN_UnNu057 [Fistulifera solaris]|eukprot:GAX15906.1 hypothetical protein FisN_UnNu057 [Fistulifera solaris]
MNSAAVDSSRFSHLATDLQDGDVWCERVTVCESATKDGAPKLLLRSYYRNRRTGERVWDEPPSGASQVQHATPAMRARGEEKLRELRSTLAMIPTEQTKGTSQKKKKRGFFGMFQKNKSNELVEDSKDLNLQKAIALSMSNQSASRQVHYDDQCIHDDDEEVALAKALSLSEEDF